MSAVLRALATLAQQRGGTLATVDASSPWLRCEALLREAQAMATLAEQRPDKAAATPSIDGERNAALDYLAQAGRSPATDAQQNGAIADEMTEDGLALDGELDGLDLSQLTAGIDLSKLRADLEEEAEFAADDISNNGNSASLNGDGQPDANGQNNGAAMANAGVPLSDSGSVDWSQVSEDEAWARELLEDN